jgi:sterol desaturase/sphingolipid hydroxylase (fatty acid hydroxylase superfamily)
MQGAVRFGMFLLGLASLHLWERTAPHHPPDANLTRRWVRNLGLGLISGVIVSLACAFCLAYQTPGSGLLRLHLLPFGVRLAVELALLDLVTYLLHRAYHRVPILWRLHMVHHSDEDLDVSSASRFHPGEVVFSAVLKIGFVLALGISAIGLVVFETVMLVCAQLQHSNIRIHPRVERWMWRSVVPPEMHRLHHSPAVRDTDSNYGTVLTLWDRMFGTLNDRPRDAAEPFGIAAGSREWGLFRLLSLPFRRTRRAAA